MVLESFLGDTLVYGDGKEVSTSKLSTDKGGVIALYFSASWYGGYSADLANVYSKIKEAGKDFEIIFVSLTDDLDSFTECLEQQPWLFVPFTNLDNIFALREKYRVMGSMKLIFLQADTGNTISNNGCKIIDDYGANGFPFTTQRLAQCREEIQQEKEEVLKEALKLLSKVGIMGEPDKECDILEMHARKIIALAFVKGHECHESTMILWKLFEIQEKIGEEKLAVIVVPVMDDIKDNFSAKTLLKMKGLPMIARDGRAQVLADRTKSAFKDFNVPQVFVIDANNNFLIKIISENAGELILSHGADAFPWNNEAIAAKLQCEKAFIEVTRTKKENFEFFTPCETCHIINKDGTEVLLATLQSKDVIGIYFSRKWSRACRMFTPRLVEMYSNCKEQGKSFEVVFISSDQNEETFNEVYSEMPWWALKYDDRLLKEALTDIFRVDGVPTLVLLKGNGELITDHGRMVLSMGSDYFPWGLEELERGHLEAEEREARRLLLSQEEEEKIYMKQKELGRIQLSRHKGAPVDVKIGVDHGVKFWEFSTIAAPSAVVTCGKKAWYEITFIQGYNISQVGWATSAFEGCDRYSGIGVGDDTNSWGFDGQRVVTWFNAHTTRWGRKVHLNGNHVLGVAVDMENGKILYGLDGDWGEPLGVAFDGLDVNVGLYPAITCADMSVSVNFGDREMKFGPPDDSFEKLRDIAC